MFWMLVVERAARRRRLSLVQRKSIKAICRELKISRKVVRKVLRSDETEFRYADRIVIRQDGVIVGEHARCLGRNEVIYDPWHYVPVLARKPGGLRNGAPFRGRLLPSAMEKVRRKLKAADDGDRQMVSILTCEAGSSPRPRRQDVLVKALSEYAPTAQHRIAVEPAHQNDQPNRLAGQRQIRQTSLIPAMDPPRSRSAARTGTRHAQWTDGDERRVGLTAGTINNKTARDKAGRSEGLAHGIDSFCETSATRRHNVIKTESEPILPAETQFKPMHRFFAAFHPQSAGCRTQRPQRICIPRANKVLATNHGRPAWVARREKIRLLPAHFPSEGAGAQGRPVPDWRVRRKLS